MALNISVTIRFLIMYKNGFYYPAMLWSIWFITIDSVIRFKVLKKLWVILTHTVTVL